eukprot:11447-Chlamydomonas_euryale.AAC.1
MSILKYRYERADRLELLVLQISAGSTAGPARSRTNNTWPSKKTRARRGRDELLARRPRDRDSCPRPIIRTGREVATDRSDRDRTRGPPAGGPSWLQPLLRPARGNDVDGAWVR